MNCYTNIYVQYVYLEIGSTRHIAAGLNIINILFALSVTQTCNTNRYVSTHIIQNKYRYTGSQAQRYFIRNCFGIFHTGLCISSYKMAHTTLESQTCLIEYTHLSSGSNAQVCSMEYTR